MALSQKELEHLQNLSCLSLTPAEQEKFAGKMDAIIDFLGKLPKIDKIDSKNKKISHSLQPISGVHLCEDTPDLLKNVQHPLMNNSVVIKSVME